MIVELLVIAGLFFLAVGTSGLIRLSGTFERMHSTSKATTLGVGFTILAGAVKFYPDGVYLTALLALLFLFMTAPTGAHLIARATYLEENSSEENSGGRGENLKKFLK